MNPFDIEIVCVRTDFVAQFLDHQRQASCFLVGSGRRQPKDATQAAKRCLQHVFVSQFTTLQTHTCDRQRQPKTEVIDCNTL